MDFTVTLILVRNQSRLMLPSQQANVTVKMGKNTRKEWKWKQRERERERGRERERFTPHQMSIDESDLLKFRNSELTVASGIVSECMTQWHTSTI